MPGIFISEEQGSINSRNLWHIALLSTLAGANKPIPNEYSRNKSNALLMRGIKHEWHGLGDLSE
jgi:hypothetical protein